MSKKKLFHIVAYEIPVSHLTIALFLPMGKLLEKTARKKSKHANFDENEKNLYTLNDMAHDFGTFDSNLLQQRFSIKTFLLIILVINDQTFLFDFIDFYFFSSFSKHEQTTINIFLFSKHRLVWKFHLVVFSIISYLVRRSLFAIKRGNDAFKMRHTLDENL